MSRRVIGILGGMGPKSTGPFLDAVVQECQTQYGAKDDIDFPEMVILSLPTPFYLDRPIDHDAMRRTIIRGLQKLERSGASFIAMPCNSAHVYFEELRESTRVPLLNIVRETLNEIPRQTSVTLFATPTTFDSGVYQKGIISAGCQFAFDDSWQPRINHTIAAIKGGDLKAAMDAWQMLMTDARHRRVETIVVACTDLNIVAHSHPVSVPLVDSSKALAKAVVREYLRNEA